MLIIDSTERGVLAKGGIRLNNLSQVEEAMFAFGRELSKIEVIPYRWYAAPDVNTDSNAVDAYVAGCASVKSWRKARLAATGKSTGYPARVGQHGSWSGVEH